MAPVILDDECCFDGCFGSEGDGWHGSPFLAHTCIRVYAKHLELALAVGPTVPCIISHIRVFQEKVRISAYVDLLSGMSQGFASFLAEALDRAALLRKDFAEKAGTSPGFITDLIKGRRTPPLERITEWAELLGLKGKQRETFFELAAIAHLPPLAQPHFLAILQRLDKLEALAQSLARDEKKRRN